MEDGPRLASPKDDLDEVHGVDQIVNDASLNEILTGGGVQTGGILSQRDSMTNNSNRSKRLQPC